MKKHFNTKNAWRLVKVALLILSLAFAYNSGKRDAELWHEQHKPGYDHYVFIRAQSRMRSCHIEVLPGNTITVMNDGHVERNLTPSTVENCELQWFVQQQPLGRP